jgi:nucleoside 2-deoxyribosyltransferase
VYLAGPEVFLPDANAIGERKKRMCEEYGFEGLYPSVTPHDDDPGTSADLLMYRAYVAMMREAHLGILNLTPFRGPSADVRTVFELGMLAGLGKPVFGYTNVTESLFKRIKDTDSEFDLATKVWRDAAGTRESACDSRRRGWR